MPLLLVPIPLIILLAPGLRPSGVADAAPEIACAEGEAERRAVYVVDLRKPLPADHAQRPGELLERVSNDVDAGTEIAVYALSRYAEAPRTLLGRLCKPHDNSDLMLATREGRRRRRPRLRRSPGGGGWPPARRSPPSSARSARRCAAASTPSR